MKRRVAIVAVLSTSLLCLTATPEDERMPEDLADALAEIIAETNKPECVLTATDAYRRRMEGCKLLSVGSACRKDCDTANKDKFVKEIDACYGVDVMRGTMKDSDTS